MARGEVRSVYTDTRNVFWTGRTIDIEATRKLRSEHHITMREIFYVVEAPAYSLRGRAKIRKSLPRHVIRREVLKAAVDGAEANGLAVHRKLVAQCNDWLAPALDEALSSVAPADEYWILERLEVDAGSFTPELFERDFVNVVAAAVERQIRERAAAGRSAEQRAGAREEVTSVNVV